MQLPGEAGRFTEVSSTSGMDHPGDGRVLCLLDFDRDGWLDYTLASGNAPKLQLYHNRIGTFPGMERRTCVGVRFIGGNWTSEPSREWSPRDPVGTRITIRTASETIVREWRSGEGMGAQNGSVLVIGLGEAKKIESAEVRWPNGRITVLPELQPGLLATVYENPAQGPGGVGVTTAPYHATSKSLPTASAIETRTFAPSHARVSNSKAQLRVYSSMATWCPSCRRELPTYAHLRSSLGQDAVAFFGVPSDPSETSDVLRAFAEDNEPAYDLLVDLARKDVDTFMQLAIEHTRVEVRPSTIVTDRQGRVLLRKKGPPTVSELRSLLDALARAESPRPPEREGSGR